MAELILNDVVARMADRERRFEVGVASLRLATGEAVALTGRSGSGKTLLLEMIGLMRRPGEGARYVFEGPGGQVDLAALWRSGPRSQRLAAQRGTLFGFVPQSGGLLPFLTVAENVSLVQQISGRIDPGWQRELLKRLGLEQVSGLRPPALSIGQRQRTAIARALAHRPAFVIADEPTSALDPDNADVVIELMLEIAAAQRCGVILSSHDLGRLDRLGIRRLQLEVTTKPDGGVASRLAQEAPA